MAGKKVLFISGSFGLGHVTRDIALAKELRKQNPGVEISWIASEPASNLLKDDGEKLLPESKEWANENITAENAAQETKLNIVKMLFVIRNDWKNNVKLFTKVTKKESFDLVIGDETYEIIVALKKKPKLKTMPFVIIYDFIGSHRMTNSPTDIFGTYYWNYFWSKDYHKESPFVDMRLFVGELEDIPDTKFGFLLPRVRDWAVEKCTFAGYVLPFNPREYKDKKEIRAKLRYGDEPLVVCTIGGTAVGKEMLALCARSFPILKEKIPRLRMILVCGPRLSPDKLNLPKGIEATGYVPKLYEHFAASDLAVVQAGATSTIELTALKKPFLYFPLEDHYEQRIHVSHRLTRHKAGVSMEYSETTPESLAQAIIENIGRETHYSDIPTDGAGKAARFISQLL
jgi:UDP-N-acetylglucosamine:LPS N-acetylglucosamine transferase